MLNIDDPREIDKTPAIWRLGFRPFFLGGALLACLYIPLWLVTWYIPEFSLMRESFWVKVVPLWWHPHEMLFGFAMAIACGFLLTSVQTWTNQPSLKGWPLALTFACWLLARVLLLLPMDLPIWLPAIFDSLFLLLCAAKLWSCIYRVKQWRNIGFPIMLLLAALINLYSYYCLMQRDFISSNQLWQGMLWWLGVIITIVAGRVIPFFTAVKIQQPKPEPIKLLDFSLIGLMLLLIVQGVTKFLPIAVEQLLLAAAALLHLLRWLRWYPHKTLGEPMLWSLHLAYVCLPITLAALAYNIDNENAYRHLLHLFAIGTMAGLCLSMISRVSLGHTSRNIYQGPKMSWAFLSVALAAMFRALMPLWFPQHAELWLWLAGTCWSLGFGWFVFCYAPILLRPRVDGRPG
ncbi:NnrS family protein [Shewanella sp. Isolate11]|uniref:NnrS family protein n=1 Tax=Shewanella sp. Isolate11 TaxID=2908530 RepID=UPI001EFD7A09|nr:NnrS family protein [Shewanella sp. Isolate11]MCG9695561.1 NnrS family protein [Shewanella sp. Isolate11]